MISFLVPFREDSTGSRTRVWEWLRAYWTAYMPEAQIIIGDDDGTPYSKSAAVNNAVYSALGDIYVVLDADSYIHPNVIRDCAARIRAASRPTWFLPHAGLLRMTAEDTDALLARDPATAGRLDVPATLEDKTVNAPGAVQIMSRRAFEKVGGMDPRFRGWGGEDSAFVRAVDTLYGAHTRLYDCAVLHFWHERPGRGSSKTRRWDGQSLDGPRSSVDISRAYKQAFGDPERMRALVDEGLQVRQPGEDVSHLDPAVDHTSDGA